MMRHLGLLLLVFGAACSATDPAYRTDDGRDLRALDPLPYRLAIAMPDSEGRLDGKPRGKKEYWFTKDDAGVQEMLVALMEPDSAAAEEWKLETQRAANGVLALDAPDLPTLLEAAQNAQVDLIIQPRLIEPPQFEYLERVRTLPSIAWWLTTWVGGLHVQDRRYEARMSMDFDIVSAHDGTALATFTATSETMDLTLWERSGRRFGSSNVAESAVIPPQLTRDRRPRVSEALTRLVTARLAARLTGYLKQDFVARERALLGAVRAVEPRNGTDVAGQELAFRAEIVGEHPITHVAIYLNGDRTPAFEISEASELKNALVPSHQALGQFYRLSVTRTQTGDAESRDPVRLHLRPGRNEVRLEYAIAGKYASRTFVYTNGAAAK